MAIDFNRLNNANTPVSSGRSGSAQSGTRSEAVSGQSASAQAQAQPAEKAKSGETVQLSSEAQQLQKITDKLRDLPAVDKERVEKLKQSIADGSYQVDSRKIASKMLALESQR
ncbi:flagellar biosynthesis anti-sigma factor FlgM [Pseudomonas mangiferae]|uniref:Negative regulator of flagellin synthesis n=1 Tax=Pseudomonas mangiferae TaxID=2593654 RepID=A0A553GUW1_9PSED|nr:flagellar biosynthesis anti-sigma factor FlgM [Pseudomonas mangiferae]TRX73269.1 flagellar biosynthesis anti-sigma factor FlgM [Pseudomonas mangiferae]